MRIGLIGYGKMGKAIEQVILEEGKHEVTLKITDENIADFTVENLQKNCDVAIEFTQPEAAYHNVLKCFEANVPVVVGTTAWLDKLPEIKERCEKEGKTVFVSPNFSIGVNLFFELNKKLAALMKHQKSYEVSMVEIHHTEKKDAPSGTAVKLAQDVFQIHPTKRNWSLTESTAETLRIEALREENVPGTHLVTYTSDIDFIEIKHEAKGRKGFATGAVRAAEYIFGKQGFFEMKDLLQF